MGTSFFSTTGSVIAMLTGMVALGIYVQKFKLFKNVGPALTVIIMGIILSNLKIAPAWHDVYGVIMTYAIPVSMTIMLMGIDLKSLLKLSKEPLVAMAIAVFSVCIVAFGCGLVFAGGIEEGWKVTGMFVGTYTGGSSNLTAIGTALNVTPQTLAAANAADYVIGMPTLVLMFAAPGILMSSKKFQKFWPYSVPNAELDTGDHKELMAAEEWSIKDLAIYIAIGFIVTEVATYLAGFAPASFSSAARILLITTIAIPLAQTAPIKKLRGNLNLGLYICLLYLCIIGISVDIKGFLGSAFSITLFCFCIIVGCLIVHLALCRIFKIKYQYVVLSIVGAIADGTTSAMVAAAGGWKSLISVGIIMGTIGGVCGNYVGIAVAYAVKAALGI